MCDPGIMIHPVDISLILMNKTTICIIWIHALYCNHSPTSSYIFCRTVVTIKLTVWNLNSLTRTQSQISQFPQINTLNGHVTNWFLEWLLHICVRESTRCTVWSVYCTYKQYKERTKYMKSCCFVSKIHENTCNTQWSWRSQYKTKHSELRIPADQSVHYACYIYCLPTGN